MLSESARLLQQDTSPSIVIIFGPAVRSGTTVLERGFFVKENLIATCYSPIKHILDASALGIRTLGGDFHGQVKRIAAFDEELDVALVELDSSAGVPLSVLEGEKVVVGEPVNFGSKKYSPGEPILEAVWGFDGNCYLLVSPRSTAAIGGPVLNQRGIVIGMVVSAREPNENFSYAPHVSYLASMLIRLARDGSTKDSRKDLPDNSRRSADCVWKIIKNSESLPPPPAPPPPVTTGEKAELPKIIRKSGGLLQSTAIKRVTPEYPVEAKAAGVSGPVVVELVIDEDGSVISARSISGDSLLRDAAVTAARQWKFRRTMLTGVAVKVIGTITFNFNL